MKQLESMILQAQDLVKDVRRKSKDYMSVIFCICDKHNPYCVDKGFRSIKGAQSYAKYLKKVRGDDQTIIFNIIPASELPEVKQKEWEVWRDETLKSINPCGSKKNFSEGNEYGSEW